MTPAAWRHPPCEDCTGEGLCSSCAGMWGRIAQYLDGQRQTPRHAYFYELETIMPAVDIGAESLAPDEPLGSAVRVDVAAWIELSNWRGMADKTRLERLRAEARLGVALRLASRALHGQEEEPPGAAPSIEAGAGHGG